ncbi:hypothetical protein FOZ63_021044 [Perkinsus olseni]|uniref:Uncharacterized protein n=1 Tax=Perkinsus olseni TaxID=32597 RepID=A0A7J6RSK1_PEROL|nr:hypothetical protein FOZ63_021044 [Perkinsus olseni]
MFIILLPLITLCLATEGSLNQGELTSPPYPSVGLYRFDPSAGLLLPFEMDNASMVIQETESSNRTADLHFSSSQGDELDLVDLPLIWSTCQDSAFEEFKSEKCFRLGDGGRTTDSIEWQAYLVVDETSKTASGDYTRVTLSVVTVYTDYYIKFENSIPMTLRALHQPVIIENYGMGRPRQSSGASSETAMTLEREKDSDLEVIGEGPTMPPRDVAKDTEEIPSSGSTSQTDSPPQGQVTVPPGQSTLIDDAPSSRGPTTRSKARREARSRKGPAVPPAKSWNGWKETQVPLKKRARKEETPS